MPNVYETISRAGRPMLGAALALAAAPAFAASAASPSAAPSDTVAIRLFVDRSEGDLMVYSIPIRFGARTLEAVLDTGSVPALVLKGRVPPRDARPTGQTFSVTYGGTRTFTNEVVAGPVRLGALDGTIPFGVVSGVKCTMAGATCATTGEGPRDAFFAGRYPVIVGARVLVGPYPVTSVFRELGVHRFVLTAPRQGEGDGSLQLDPNTNATSTFVPIANDTSGLPVPGGSAHGCISDTRNGVSFCGAIFLDSGRTGIEIFPTSTGPQSPSWSPGDPARLEFNGAGGASVAGVDFTVGVDAATRVTFAAPGQYAEPVIYVGQLPYIGLSILTDLDAGTYAVLPRSRAKDGVVGHVP